MPTLSAQDLIDLEAIKTVSLENFTTQDAIDYYTFLEGKGFAYGTLALGVVEDNAARGRIANAYAESKAAAEGIDFSVGSEAWKEMQWNLIQNDWQRRSDNNGADLTWQQYEAAHTAAFDAVSLPPDTWTAYTPLTQSNEMNPLLAAALWDDLVNNTGYYDGWFSEGLSAAFSVNLVQYESVSDLMVTYGEGLEWYGHMATALAQAGVDAVDDVLDPLDFPDFWDDFDKFRDFIEDRFGVGNPAIPATWPTGLGDMPNGSIGLPGWIPGVSGPFVQGEVISPLVLDIDMSGTIELAALNGTGSVYWDIDLDGFSEASGWITGGDGLLTVDVNADGIITHNELFGNNGTYANGYLKLDALYDTNNDNAITSTDTGFGDLRVWVDANADGYSQSGELHTLSSLGITSLSTSYTTGTVMNAGNEVRQHSTFTMNGNGYTSGDVWFAYDNINTRYSGDYTLDIRTLFLPTLRGYGNLPDLHIAMSQNEDLLEIVQNIAAAEAGDIFSDAFDLRGRVETLMYEWADVTGVSPTARGAFFDAQKLGFLEDVMGRHLMNSASSTPNGQQSVQLRLSWDAAFSATTARLLAQSDMADDIIEDASYNAVTDSWSGSPALNLAGIESLAESFCADAGVLGKFYAWNSIFAVIDQAIGLSTLSSGAKDDLMAIAHDTTSISSFTFSMLSPGSVDVMWGTLAAEVMQGNSSNNFLYGGIGNELLMGGNGHDIFYGGLGFDELQGGAGNDIYYFAPGEFNASTTYDIVTEDAGYGTDTIRFVGINATDMRMWSDTAYTYFAVNGSPNDVLRASHTYGGITAGVNINARIEQIVFDDATWDLTTGLQMTDTDSAHDMRGTSINDVLDGRGGNDTLYGHNGDDTLYGGDGADSLYGNNGNDSFYGQAGADHLEGGTGNDTYYFSVGFVGASGVYDNLLEEASAGTDTIRFVGINAADIRSWSDYSYTYFAVNGSPNDVLRVSQTYGGATTGVNINSRIEQIVFDDATWYLTSGLQMTDTDVAHNLYGTSANDILDGRGDADTLYGYNGNDTLYGGDGADTLYGGGGDDIIYGGAGADSITGDSGADTVAFEIASAFSAVDTIYGFSTANADKLDIGDLLIGYDPLTSLVTDFVEITTSGSNSILKVDRDGTGGSYSLAQVATIYGVTGLTDEAALVTNGNLVVA